MFDMSHLFYFVIPHHSPKEGDIVLQGEEAHHAIRVVRVKAGEHIGFIDGQGGKWFCKVTNICKDILTAKIIKYQYIQKETDVCLIIGWLHRDNAIETLVTYGTEMGISEFRFFQSERSTRPIRRDDKIKRWVVQSCKIVGRPWFPNVTMHEGLLSAIKDFEGKLLIATASHSSMSISQVDCSKPCGLIIGPEGDFSENEIAMAEKAGAKPIYLGPDVYRSELSALLGSFFILGKQGYFEKSPQNNFSFD